MQKKQYKWKQGAGRFNIDAQVAGERYSQLEEQASRLGRGLHRKDIYEDAKDPTSPFHAEVFLDAPPEAERKWRLECCGRIQRSLEYTVVNIEMPEHKPMEVQYPVTIHIQSMGHVSTARVLSNEDLRKQAVGQILAQIRAYVQKLKLYDDPALIKLALDFEALCNRNDAA